MQLQPLTLNYKPMFDEYVHQMCPRLSSYAFSSLYVWREHFQFYWIRMAKYLCIFAKQNDDYFMPILPMPYEVNSCSYLRVVHEAYRLMLELSRNPYIARIENVPQEMLSFFKKNGFYATLKETEYLYETEALSRLSGNRYKSKRSAYNAFATRYPSATLDPYCSTNRDACFALYNAWQTTRATQCSNDIYCAMLNDSQSAHQIAITHADALGLLGGVVHIDGEIKAYTFGYPLNADIFCVLFEVADLNIRGLAQFIYREFCRELMGTYKWINAMDDSGLESLSRVKHSYHPIQLIPSYNVMSSDRSS